MERGDLASCIGSLPNLVTKYPQADCPQVVMSVGAGPLHFVEAAQALQKAGQRIRFVTGLVPSDDAVRFALCTTRRIGYAAVGESLRARLTQRHMQDVDLRCCPLADASGMLLATLLGRSSRAARWRLMGRASRRHVRGAQIFHVRSGAGQGGAIAAARSHGLRILVDHSIAHPAWMAKTLEDEYQRYGAVSPFREKDPFWELVTQDCHDADAILVNSGFVEETFLACGIPKNRIHVAYLGVRPCMPQAARSYRMGSRIRLLFVGDFGIRKGAGYLLDALHQIDPSRSRFRLTVLGSYREVKCLRRLHAFSTHDDLREWSSPAAVTTALWNSDVFVLPSLAEGCAKAGMEALATALPVIVTREAGLPVQHRQSAFVVRSSSVASLVQALDELCSDEGLRCHLGEQARQTALACSWLAYAANVKSIYETMLPAASS